MKQRLIEEGSEVVTFCHGLKLLAPAQKVEPLKRWLARVGYERIQEIEDPELTTKRTRMLYKLKGYPDSWIEKLMRGIAIREELTDEWQNRGAEEKKAYCYKG